MPPRTVRYSAFAPATLAELAERAFARAAGSPAIEGNAVRVLWDARENFRPGATALARAQRYILFECYIVEDDSIGREFAALLAERARAGVHVNVIIDWLGCWRALSLWRQVRDAGGDVRVFNPPRLSSPFGWLSRDHRKMIVVDGKVGYVSGLCVSERWLGNPRAAARAVARHRRSTSAVPPWRRSSRRSCTWFGAAANSSTRRSPRRRQDRMRRRADATCTSSRTSPTSPALFRMDHSSQRSPAADCG